MNKNRFLFLFLPLIATAASAGEIVVEVLNPAGHVEAAFLLGNDTEAEKSFDAIITYRVEQTVPYPLEATDKSKADLQKEGIGTRIRVSGFEADAGNYRFSLRIEERHFEGFIESFGPSRAIRLPTFTTSQIETHLSMMVGDFEAVETADRSLRAEKESDSPVEDARNWAVRLRALD